jgi:hypothetical protein
MATLRLPDDLTNRNAAYQVDDISTGIRYLVAGTALKSFLKGLRASGDWWYHVEMWCTAQERFENDGCNKMLRLPTGVEVFS